MKPTRTAGSGEVSYVAGERHGPFIYSNAAGDWRENGEFVRGKRHGPVVQTYGRKDGGGCRVEGRYADGRKDGPLDPDVRGRRRRGTARSPRVGCMVCR